MKCLQFCLPLISTTWALWLAGEALLLAPAAKGWRVHAGRPSQWPYPSFRTPFPLEACRAPSLIQFRKLVKIVLFKQAFSFT